MSGKNPSAVSLGQRGGLKKAENARLRAEVNLGFHENYCGFCLTCDEPWPCAITDRFRSGHPDAKGKREPARSSTGLGE